MTKLPRIPTDILGDLLEARTTAQVTDFANGDQLSGHRVYSLLTWLRRARSIDKKGPDGFVVRRGSLGDGDLDTL